MPLRANQGSPVPPNPKTRRGVGYRDIASQLIAEIHRGAWKAGGMLPSEAELVARFGVGRNTVREAFRQLQELGYIVRRRGARSVLASAAPQDGFVNSVRSIEALLHYVRLTSTTLLATDHIKVDENLSKRLGVGAGTEWVRLGILRSRDMRALCFSEVYLEPRFKDISAIVEGETSIYALIEQRYGLVCSSVEQEIEADAASADVASRLNIPVGSPILFVRTKFYADDGRLFEVGLTHFPARRYKVRMRLERKPQGSRPDEPGDAPD